MFAFAVAILLARMYGIDWLRKLLKRIFGTGDQQQSPDQQSGESQTAELEMPPPSPVSQTTDFQISESINISDSLSSTDNTDEPAPLPSLAQTDQEIVEV